MKRYIVTLDFYIYADDDVDAIEKALNVEKHRNKMYDDNCKVVSLHEQPVGTLVSREVKLNK